MHSAFPVVACQKQRFLPAHWPSSGRPCLQWVTPSDGFISLPTLSVSCSTRLDQVCCFSSFCLLPSSHLTKLSVQFCTSQPSLPPANVISPTHFFVLLITCIISFLSFSFSLSLSLLLLLLRPCGPLSCPYLLPHMASCGSSCLIWACQVHSGCTKVEAEMPGMLNRCTQYMAPKAPLFPLLSFIAVHLNFNFCGIFTGYLASPVHVWFRFCAHVFRLHPPSGGAPGRGSSKPCVSDKE